MRTFTGKGLLFTVGIAAISAWGHRILHAGFLDDATPHKQIFASTVYSRGVIKCQYATQVTE